MSAHELETRVLPVLLAGTSRQSLDVSALLEGAIPADDLKAGLKALALTGQALRLRRPALPPAYAVPVAGVTRRAVIADDLRAPLLRLVGDGKASVAAQSELAQGLAFTLDRLRLQPHPFDFHRLDGFLKTHADRLGPEVCAWVDRDKEVEDKRGYFDVPMLDDSNWQEATPARRQAYVEARRKQDPAAGRGLVEAVWGATAAELRLRLLAALRVGLSPADRPFLEQLANDRAPKVRELAARHLSRLPGAGGSHGPLKAAMERIRRGSSGLIFRHATLQLELPATVNALAPHQWIGQTFGDIELGEFARAFDLTPEKAIAAAEKDQNLLFAMLLMATREARLESVAAILRLTSATLGWQWMTTAPPDLLGLDPADRLEWVDLVIDAGPAGESPSLVALLQVFRMIEGPVAERTMAAILGGRAWQERSQAKAIHFHLPALAALCPPAARDRLRADLADLDPQHTFQPLAYLDLLDTLEKAVSHD